MPRARLHLVRHGEASAGWGSDADPGLSPLGREQAARTASVLAAQLARTAVVTSPLRRAQETAAALVEHWDALPTIDPAFGEIPSPSDDLAERAAWLPGALRSRWDELDDAVAAWRRRLITAACTFDHDVVVTTHFVAINALVGHAGNRPEATVFLPANASITVIDVGDDGGLELVDLGSEAPPVVG